jgi:hypothetical protein
MLNRPSQEGTRWPGEEILARPDPPDSAQPGAVLEKAQPEREWPEAQPDHRPKAQPGDGVPAQPGKSLLAQAGKGAGVPKCGGAGMGRPGRGRCRPTRAEAGAGHRGRWLRPTPGEEVAAQPVHMNAGPAGRRATRPSRGRS